MDSPAQYASPNTLAEAAELLRACGHAAPRADVWATICRQEGDTMKRALLAVANNSEQKSAASDYLASIMAACAPKTTKVVAALGFNLNVGTLVRLAKKEGAALRNAIRSFDSDNPADPNMASIARYLNTAFGAAQAYQNQHDGVESARSEPTRAPVPTPPSGTQIPEALRAQQSTPRASSSNTQPSNVANLNDRRRTAPARDSSQGQARDEAPSSGFEVSHHIYGGKAALCFQPTRKGELFTVNIDAAYSNGPRQYNWAEKVIFQLTPAELPLVYGVLVGLGTEVVLSGHGRENEKSFSIADQGNKFFMSLRVKDKTPIAVPVLPKDAFQLMGMIYAQMKKNNQDVSDQFLLRHTSRVCEMNRSPEQRQQRAANQ